MLRAYFMPCDFYPKILFCGEKQDIQTLYDALTYFLSSKIDLELSIFKQLQLQNLNLILKYQEKYQQEGVIHIQDSDNFNWYLSSEQIIEYLQELNELIHSEQDSGSVYFELLKPNEIKIKISMGEFDDSYLRDG